ncbi:MAG: polyprenol monophosphomannose synthase [Actinomycetota bacterium]|nr:polyprenol monophosphomannose synthase [Actinomycetota bacterium]
MTVPNDVIVIVPTFNEAENIEAIAVAVRARGYRLLIVDDGSPDGTGEIADVLVAADEGIAVLHRDVKAGLGRAYAAGFARALELDGAVLCEMDADFSHDPADLPRLVAAIDGGADLAIGSRYVPGGGADDWPWHRRAISSGGNRYAALMLGLKVKDATAGYRAFRADAVRRLRPETCDASGYAFQVEMAWRASEAGLKITEVPIRFRDREAGTSKMTPSIAFEAMLLVTRWGWRRRFGSKE